MDFIFRCRAPSGLAVEKLITDRSGESLRETLALTIAVGGATEQL
jgi:hypothetical protein